MRMPGPSFPWEVCPVFEEKIINMFGQSGGDIKENRLSGRNCSGLRSSYTEAYIVKHQPQIKVGIILRGRRNFKLGNFG